MTAQINPMHFAGFAPAADLTDAKQWSFWDLVDLGVSHRYGVAEAIRKYNLALPSCKGRLRGGESLVAKILLHLMSIEMERKRKESPADYYYYLSDKIDCIPVATNRGQLRTMLDAFYSKNTIGSYIGRLMDCGIIKRKLNTSRVMERVQDKNGNVSMVRKVTQKGRGDMLLFISKEILYWVREVATHVDEAEAIPTAAQDAGQNPAFSAIDNQGLNYGETQNLGQSLKDSLETLKRKKNKSGKGAAELPNSFSADAEGRKQIGDKASRSCPPRQVPSFVVNEVSKIVPGGGVSRETIYREKVNFEQRFISRLPQNDLDYFTMLLFAQMRGQIYPHFSDDVIQMKEVQAKALLMLHLKRLEGSLVENFQILSRAIVLTRNWLAQDEMRYVYDILTWLRVDGEYQSGTLLRVVEDWIPKERKRLQLNIEEDKPFLAWQYATTKAELLFFSFAKKLRKGFHGGITAARTTAKELRIFCEKLGIDLTSQNKIMNNFMERVNVILQQVGEKGKRGQKLSLQEIYKIKKRKYEASSRTNTSTTGKANNRTTNNEKVRKKISKISKISSGS